jgi:hypothetical protein
MIVKTMTKQEILELYGQSVYEIRLAIAMHLYPKTEDPVEALALADKFIGALGAERASELKGKW